MRKVASIKSWVEEYDLLAKNVEDLELMPDFVREGLSSEEELESRTDLEVETIRDVLAILKKDFEEESK